MGMDVYGRKPKSTVGEYFRNNVWYWRPLADLCVHLAPDVCAACKHWHSNDGDGLNAKRAAQLADVLETHLQSGDIARLVTERDARLASLPTEPCTLCDGIGIRRDAIGTANGQPEQRISEPADHPRLGQTGWCNGCDGVGRMRSFITNYPLTEENVAEFVAFLKDCGGFRIH